MQLSEVRARATSEWSLSWTAAIVVSLLLWGAYEYDQVPAIKVETLRGVADPAKVTEAGTLTIRWSAERTSICPATIAREIVDSANTVFRIDRVSGPTSSTLGYDEWVMTLTVPPAAAWGRAIYRSSIQYDCGFTHGFWPLIIHSPEVPFEIVPLPQSKIQELRG